MNKLLVLLCTLLIAACINILPHTHLVKDELKQKIQSSPQRIGDPMKGRDYLINGNFVDSGFPMIGGMNIYEEQTGEISPFTEIKSSTGVKMIAPNCFQCHADSLNGKYVLGLPNTRFDFTVDMTYATKLMKGFLDTSFDTDSPEKLAALPFLRAMEATAPHIQTKVVGTNPADKLAAVLAAYRYPDDLSWRQEPGLPIPSEVVPADPPAWWLLKKKHAMFATAVGRGDFARLMMASSLLTLQDTVKAREVDGHFADVLSYIKTLEPPQFPENINMDKADTGKLIFVKHCSACHGTYGESGRYPNLLVDISLVKTDSLLAFSNFAYPKFIDWYNTSWFSLGKYSARLQAGRGYVAPPLDGVWATAPYFHNASVPTVYHVLNSKTRPVYWTKSSNSYDLDYEKLGWKFRKFERKVDKYTYDTTLPGYQNVGHYFGDKLTEDERYAVIEYLKTL